MSNLLIQIILAASNSEGEDAIWMQILVLIILAGSFGIYSLARAKANKAKEQTQGYPQKFNRLRLWQSQLSLGYNKSSHSASIAETDVKEQSKPKQPMFNFSAPVAAVRPKPKRKLANKINKNLNGGMELLDLDFLLSIIENTDGEDEKDITIRKLNFKELLRRGKLNEADSKALKIYALNKGNRYGKDIQCEALKSLAERTASDSYK